MKTLEKRMYFFVPYNISEIQKGIQAGHAALEYAYKYGDSFLFKDFIKNWKTWIILNGGTTNDSIEYVGSLNEIQVGLFENEIDHTIFVEPDLNNALTAICFICTEKVFNWKDYPNFIEWSKNSGSYKKYYSNDQDWVDLAWENNDLINKYLNDFEMTKKDFYLKKLIGNKRLA